MKRRKEDLDLEYLNNRINTLTKRFNRFEDACYFWKNEDREDIDELKEELKEAKKK
jgi:hypothetical protein